jgi:hypothetical protein
MTQTLYAHMNKRKKNVRLENKKYQQQQQKKKQKETKIWTLGLLSVFYGIAAPWHSDVFINVSKNTLLSAALGLKHILFPLPVMLVPPLHIVNFSDWSTPASSGKLSTDLDWLRSPLTASSSQRNIYSRAII